MIIFTIRRILQSIPTLIGVAVTVFLFLHALPGNPARIAAGPEATEMDVKLLEQRFGLDKPIPVQFVYFVENIAKGNLGNSYRNQEPATVVIRGHFVRTLVLSVSAIGIAVIGGVLFGVIAAVRRNSWVDLSLTALAVGGISIPSFFLGIVFIYIFAVYLRLLPVGGGGGLKALILPSVTLGLAPLGTIARFVRSSVLEVLSEDFVRTARAKGLREAKIIFTHVLKNALIPVITMTGLQFGFLLGGAVIVETVFNYPGMGWLLVLSINSRDYPVIEGLLLVFSLEFVVVNFLVDLLYGVADPRISYG